MILPRIVVLICLIVGSRLSAQLVDNFDTTANFDAGFNGTSATANGDGTVTLFRTQSGTDAGIDWMQGGTSFLSLASEDLLAITPASSGSINGGMYNVNILFWTSTDDFVAEVNWLSDSTSISPQTLDVSQFAIDNNVSPTATDYFVRFRIEPETFSGADPGFTFDEIQAVPEPNFAWLSLLALGYLINIKHKKVMKKYLIASFKIVAVALLASISAKAQVSIISENFNTSLSTGTSFTQYHGGDTTSYANGIVAGVGVGGTGGWQVSGRSTYPPSS